MNKYDSKEEKGLVPAGEEIKEERRVVSSGDNNSEEVYPLPPSIKSRTLIWSALSIVFAGLCIFLCKFYYVGIVLAALTVGSALMSRKTLGFFDKYAIWGIIFGIFGFIANVFSMIAQLSGLV